MIQNKITFLKRKLLRKNYQMSPYFRRTSPLKSERLGVGEAQILVDTCAQSLELTPLQVSQKHEGASHAAFLFSQKASLLCSFGFNHSEMRAIQRQRWNKGPL